MTYPKIAVLLATYNGEPYCEAQLISALWQRKADVHVHVRDDGSRDDTMGIVRAVASRYPERVHILNNRGVPTGSPTGNFFALLTEVDLSSYDYVAFADQDDVWTPDKLGRAVTAMRAAGDADGYSSDLIAYHGKQNVAWMLHKAGRDAALDYLFQGGSAGCTYVLSRHAAMVAAAVVTAAPAPCPGASHDWILYAICRSRKMRWIRDAGAEILYRQHEANEYGARRGFGDVLAKLRLTRTRWYRDHILWNRHVVAQTPEECRVLDAVARGRVRDRWWLVSQASRFRREKAAVAQLRLAIMAGMV